MKNTNIIPALVVVVLATVAFFGTPLLFPPAEAQRMGYVEKQKVSTGTATGVSALANQLAPNPVAGKALTPVGTDTKQVKWGDFMQGTGALTGTLNYLQKVTAGGLGDSHASESGGALNVTGENLIVAGDGLPTVQIKNASDLYYYPMVSLVRQRGTLASPSPVNIGDILGAFAFYGLTSAGAVGGAAFGAYADSITSEGYIVGKECFTVSDGSNGGANKTIFCAHSDRVQMDTPLNLGATYGVPKLLVYDDGTNITGMGAFSNDTMRVFGNAVDKRITFGYQTRANVFTQGAQLVDGTLTLEGGLVAKALPGKAIGNVLYDTDGAGTVGEKALSASDFLPAGTPGQVAGIVAATATRTVVVTGTQTSVGTETYSYTVSQTSTTTGTVTATGATGTYTQTATGTSTGMATSGSIAVGYQPRGLAIDGTTLYVGLNGAGAVQTVNISNPASMTGPWLFDTCTSPRALVAWASNSVFVGCSDNHAEVWNCVNRTNCTRTYDIAVDDITLSAANYAGGGSMSNYVLMANSTDNNVQVINMANGTVAGTTSAITGCSPWGITALSTTRGAVSCSSNGRVYVVDYSTPSAPAVMGYATFTTPYSLYSWGGRYVAAADFGTDSVHIVDTNDPNSPSNIGNVSVGSGCGAFAITGQGAYLFVTCDTAGTLVAIDVSTPSSPTVLGSALTVGTNPRAIAVSGNWAFVALQGADLVKSVDISRFLTLTGTQTTTNTQTVTGTVTTTTTTTGTQTVTGTSVYTASATGTVTATGSDKWTAVNGAIYAGTNIRLTKGTDTETDTAVTMAEKPTVHLYGFSGTTNVLPKKTTDGWGDSSLSESSSGPVSSTKAMRASGGATLGTPSLNEGKGVVLSYYDSTGGTLLSYDYSATPKEKPLILWGSTLALIGNPIAFYMGSVTMTFPTDWGASGFCLKTDGEGALSWSDCAGGTTDHKTAVVENGGTGYLSDLIYSSTGNLLLTTTISQGNTYLNVNGATGAVSGTLCAGDDSRLSNARTPTAHASTHAVGGSDVVPGVLVQQYTYTSSTNHTPSTSQTWETFNQQTFTSVGSKIRVSAHVRFTAHGDLAAYSHLCGLAILADSGSTASTVRGPKDWTQGSGSNMFSNTTIPGWTDVTVQTFVGTASTVAEFSLSEGAVAVAVSLYKYHSHTYSCTVPAGEMVVYVDVYK